MNQVKRDDLLLRLTNANHEQMQRFSIHQVAQVHATTITVSATKGARWDKDLFVRLKDDITYKIKVMYKIPSITKPNQWADGRTGYLVKHNDALQVGNIYTDISKATEFTLTELITIEQTLRNAKSLEIIDIFLMVD